MNERVLTLEPFGWQEKAFEIWHDPLTKILCCMIGRGGGKSLFFEMAAIEFAFSAPRRKIIYCAQSHKLIRELYSDMMASPGFQQLLKPRNGSALNPTPNFTFQNGSKLQMISLQHGAGSALGLEADMLIVDEAREIREADWDALQPCVSRTRGKTLVLSTIRSRAHWFTTLCNKAAEPNDVGLRFIKAPSSAGIAYAGAEGLQELKRVELITPPHVFKREYQCELAQSDEAVFSPELIDGCIDYDLEPAEKSEEQTLCLVDLGRTRDPTGVTIGDQHGRLLWADQYPLGLDWSKQADKLLELGVKYNCVFVVESNGTNSDSLIGLLKPRLSPYRVVDIPIRGHTKENLMNQLVLMMEQGQLKIPGTKKGIGPHFRFTDLCRQLEAIEYKHNTQYVGYHSELHDEFVSCLMLYADALARSFAGPILSGTDGPKRPMRVI